MSLPKQAASNATASASVDLLRPFLVLKAGVTDCFRDRDGAPYRGWIPAFARMTEMGDYGGRVPCAVTGRCHELGQCRHVIWPACGYTSPSSVRLGRRSRAASGLAFPVERTRSCGTCTPGLSTHRSPDAGTCPLGWLSSGSFAQGRRACPWDRRGRRRYSEPCASGHQGTPRYPPGRRAASSRSREPPPEGTCSLPGLGANRRRVTARNRSRDRGPPGLSTARIWPPDCIRRSCPAGEACRSCQIRRPCGCPHPRRACAGPPRQGSLQRLPRQLHWIRRRSKVCEHQLLGVLGARVGNRRVGHTQSRFQELPYLELRPGRLHLGSRAGRSEKQ